MQFRVQFLMPDSSVLETALRRRGHHHREHPKQQKYSEYRHGPTLNRHGETLTFASSSSSSSSDDDDNTPANSLLASHPAKHDDASRGLPDAQTPELFRPLEVDEYISDRSDAKRARTIQTLSEQIMRNSDILYDELADSFNKVVLSRHVSKKLEQPKKIRYEFVGR